MIARGITPAYAEDGDVRVVNQKCVRGHAVNFNLARRNDSQAKRVPVDRLVQLGDVLINSTGQGTLGRVAQLRVAPDEPTTVDTHVTILRPSFGVFHLDYFGYALIQLENELAAAGEGTSGQTELARGKIADDFSVPVPPLAEQERIVSFLDGAFEAIATATANTESSRKAARDAADAEVDAVLDNQGAPWREVPLGELCDVLDSRRKPITKSDRVAGPYPYYGATGIQDHVIDYLFDEPLVLLGEDGAKWGARERSAFAVSGRIWVNNHAHVLRPDRKRLSDEWLITALNAADLDEYISGVTVPKLNQARMRDIQISLPPVDEQSTLLTHIRQVRSELSNLENAYTRKLSLLAELKAVLLARAFSGQLTAATPAANDNAFATPEQVANVIAFAQRRHEMRGRHQTFGRVKAQKNLHFVESVGGVELDRWPEKDAAGPNDFQHMLAAERWAKSRGFFEFTQDGEGYRFKKLTNYRSCLAAADAALAPIRGRLERATDLIVDCDSRTAEVLATVHAAWNNLVLDGVEVTDDAIVREARDEWHAAKLKIPASKFHEAVQSIRRLGIVPDGSAKRVGQRRLL